MISTNYSLPEEQECDIIIHHMTGVLVQVFGLEFENYVLTNGEIHIFVDDHGESLTVETKGRYRGRH